MLGFGPAATPEPGAGSEHSKLTATCAALLQPSAFSAGLTCERIEGRRVSIFTGWLTVREFPATSRVVHVTGLSPSAVKFTSRNLPGELNSRCPGSS